MDDATYFVIYDEGYVQGYYDNAPVCPYHDGTPESQAWWRGYSDGCNDF